MKKNNPSFLQSLQFVKNISVSAEENMTEYGDWFKLNLPFQSIYVVANPRVLEHILIRNEEKYIKSKIYWGQLRTVVGDALGTFEGEDFLWMKKLQMKAFTREQTGQYLAEVISSNENYFAEWNHHDQPINIIHAFSQLHVAILLKALFGKDHDGLCDTIAHYIADGEETIAWRSAFPWRPYTVWLNGRNRHSKKSLKFFDDLTQQVIRENIEKPSPGTLIDLLLNESDLFKKNSRINKKIIRNEIIINLGASTETAAVALGWTFYLLQKHPHIKQKIRQEIEELIGDQQIKPGHSEQLIYTQMVLKESLRLFPPSHGIVRDAVTTDKIGDVKVKPGDTFFISSYALHRNPKYWDSPDEFIPERFSEEPDKYTYIPFGAGKRTCIGRYLALPMMTLALAQFLQKYDLEMKVNEPVIPQSLSTLKPDQPFIARVVKQANKFQCKFPKKEAL